MANDQTAGVNTANGAEESKPKTTPALDPGINNRVGEARIIEETVVRPAHPLQYKADTAAIPSAIPVRNVVSNGANSAAPTMPGADPKTRPAIAAPIPAPTASASSPYIQKKPEPVETQGPPPLMRDIPAPEERTTRVDVSPSPELKTNIEKLLNEVKIPERRVPPGEIELSKKGVRYDTLLASPLEKRIEGVREQTMSDALHGKRLATPIEQASVSSTQTDTAGHESALKAGRESSEDNSSVVVPLHTLKNDFQDIVREKKISLVRAAALEQDKKRTTERFAASYTRTSRDRRTFNVVFTTVLLVILGSAALLGVAVIMRERSGVSMPLSDASLLFAEASFPLPLQDLSPLNVKSVLVQLRSRGGATLGSITRIVPTISTTGELPVTPESVEERPATLEEFLLSLGVNMSPELIRALGTEFFFGIHTVDKNVPLFVIPVTSFERAFAGMLEWEATMNTDLSPVFTPVPETILGADGLLASRRFEDVIIRNYDVRALKDDAEAIHLYYAFPTRYILVIAESPYSFAEVLSRLRAERQM